MNIHSQHDEIISYLEGLGVDSDGAKLYKSLAAAGPMTLLQISRLTRIERTKLYRSIRIWVDLGIIEEEMAYKTRKYRAASIERMKLFVAQKKASVDALAGSFDAFREQIAGIRQDSVSTKVLYYHGRDGLRQMLWNQMRTKGEQLTYVYKVWEEAVGYTFFRNWEAEYIKSGIKNRELRHPDLLQSRNLEKGPFKEEWPNREWRTISPKIFTINHSMELYNDVVAISYWNGDDVMGIEIYNEHIALMQRSIFDHFWKLAGKRS
jgi:sugar-specific transcriptional regulator TrmB